MTLESTICKVSYVGNGETKSFPFPFKAWKANHVAVFVGDGFIEQDVTGSCGIELSSSGGVVTFSSAPANGQLVVIKRTMPFVQQDDYRNGARFDGEEIEDRFDMDCAERQELKSDIDRSLKMPLTSSKSQGDFINEIWEARNQALEAEQHVEEMLEEVGSDIATSSYVTAAGSTASRTLGARFADIVNVKDFGAIGNGVADDTDAIDAASEAAAGRTLFFPAGTYLTTTGLRIPSNTTVVGAGMRQSIIKLSDSAPWSADGITNDQNTWDKDPDKKWTDNTGNVNIAVLNIGVDGNGWRAGSSAYSGCAVQFCNVDGLLLQNVYATRGRLHCIDIASASYGGAWDFDDGDEGYYYGASRNVVLINCVCEDSYGDDGLTIHFSHDIKIYNPICTRTVAIRTDTQAGIEIDDGSYQVDVYGGYCSGWNKGFQVKSHEDIPYAPHDVHVHGLVCESNVTNFEATHKRQSQYIADDFYLKNISFIDCTGITANKDIDSDVSLSSSFPIEMYLCDIDGCLVSRFHAVGDGETQTERGKIGLRTCKNISLEDVYFSNCVDSMGMVYVDAYCGEGNVAKNMRAYECSDAPVFYLGTIGSSSLGMLVDGVDAKRTVAGGETPSSPVVSSYQTQFKFNNYPGKVSFKRIRYSGYKCAVGENVDGGVGTLKIEDCKFVNYEEKIYRKALDTLGGADSPPLFSVGYAGSSADVLWADGVGYGFKYKKANGSEYQVASIIATRDDGDDSSTSHSLSFGVRDNSDAGTSDQIRWRIRYTGALQPYLDDTYPVGGGSYRPSVIYAGTGTINTSDARVKHNIQNIDEQVLRAWGRVRFAVFQMVNAVEAKGEDAARLHIGVIAQEVRDAFAAEWLDAGRYGLFCFDEWEAEYQDEKVIDSEAVLSEDGEVVEPEVSHIERRLVREAGNRFSIRYDEALALECAYQRWRLEQLEKRVDQLTNNTNN